MVLPYYQERPEMITESIESCLIPLDGRDQVIRRFKIGRTYYGKGRGKDLIRRV